MEVTKGLDAFSKRSIIINIVIIIAMEGEEIIDTRTQDSKMAEEKSINQEEGPLATKEECLAQVFKLFEKRIRHFTNLNK